MALSPIIEATLSNDGKILYLKDDTVYGDGVSDPSRVQSLVDWSVLYKASGGDSDITPAYNQSQDFNASPLEVPRQDDGYYELVIAITHDPADATWAGADYNYSITKRIVILYNSNRCYANEVSEIVNESMCGCENFNRILEVSLLAAKIDAADEKGCTDSDPTSAQLIVENINESCNCSNC